MRKLLIVVLAAAIAMPQVMMGLMSYQKSYFQELIIAASTNNLKEVKRLIEEVRVPSGTAVLTAAAYNGHLDIVKYLIEQKNVTTQDQKDEALVSAAEGRQLDVIKYLMLRTDIVNVG